MHGVRDTRDVRDKRRFQIGCSFSARVSVIALEIHVADSGRLSRLLTWLHDSSSETIPKNGDCTWYWMPAKLEDKEAARDRWMNGDIVYTAIIRQVWASSGVAEMRDGLAQLHWCLSHDAPGEIEVVGQLSGHYFMIKNDIINV